MIAVRRPSTARAAVVIHIVRRSPYNAYYSRRTMSVTP